MKNTSCLITSSFLLLFTLFNNQAFAQSDSGLEKIDESLLISGLATNILQKDHFDFVSFSSFNSFWWGVHQSVQASPIVDRLRYSQFNTTLDTYYGFSHSQRWDAGIRLRYARSRLDNIASNSAFKVFRSYNEEDENVNVDKTYGGLAGVGIRVRAMPIGSLPELSINAGFTFSTVQNDTTARNLGADRNVFDLNVTYYSKINANNYYYFIVNGSTFLPGENNEEMLFTSGASFFLVRMLYAQQWVIYPGLSYNMSYKTPAQLDQTLIRINEQLLGIVGLQYQPTPRFTFSTSIGIPIWLNNSALQISQIRNSYSLVTFGLRVHI
jgi:hypothetical protein